jgi:hypothetical protein
MKSEGAEPLDSKHSKRSEQALLYLAHPLGADASGKRSSTQSGLVNVTYIFAPRH